MTEGIEINPRVCGGKPVIEGTRIPVSVVLEQLSTGVSWDALLKDYPELTQKDIRSVLLYARAAIEQTDIVSSSTS